MRAFIIAFSTYSRVPMPHVNFNEKAMRYCMCFFPIVGLFIGACEVGLCYLFGIIDFSTDLLNAALLTVVPLMLTGGIHLDGFFDTCDARGSYKTREEKLDILKDPHVGSAAVMGGIVYFLLYFATSFSYLSYLADDFCVKYVVPFVYIFVIERVLSGISVVWFPKARKDGMLATTANKSDKRVGIILVSLGLLFTAVSLFLSPLLTAAVAAMALASFGYYRFMSAREFGGTTGDLAGHFLQKTELLCIVVMVLVMANN